MNKCLMVLSGGQDSTTCAAIACQQFDEVHAISFDYGQRNLIELESAENIVKALNIASYKILQLGQILEGSSPLISNQPLGQYNSVNELPTGVEPNFIPARNILFLTLAANRAAALGIKEIFTGVCQVDTASYWDCSQLFIDSMAVALSEGIYGDRETFKIHTPLMDLSKAQSVRLAYQVLGDRFEEVMGFTHTCYSEVRGGCGKCEACLTRDQGFKEAGINDPIWKFRKVLV